LQNLIFGQKTQYFVRTSSIILIVVGTIAAVSASVILASDSNSEPESVPIYESGFTYYDIELVQTALAEHGIIVSPPTAITDDTIGQYCLYFDEGAPRSVGYCTTTEVRDSSGNAIGNINLGGSIDSPILAIVNLETTTTTTAALNADRGNAFTIFENVIESLVCDCWGEQQSERFPTPTSWFEAVDEFYLDSDKRDIKSTIENLEDTRISLEITSKENSVLRTLLILKI